MEENNHSVENCPIQKQFLELEEEYNELKKNLQLSAVYGKSLLEENDTLKIQMKELQLTHEQMIQENHNLKMQMEVSKKSHISQCQEMESLKDAVSRSEEINRQLKVHDEETHRRENSLATKIACLKDQKETLKEQLELKIRDLEAEVHHLKTADKVPVLINCDHEEEITQLQIQLDICKESNSKLEESVLLAQNKVQQLQYAESRLKNQVSELECEILGKEKELASLEKLMEEKRIEVLELQSLLEAERVSQSNPDKRGNSIFSEVEDRRQQVERHLAKLTTLLDKEKRKNQDLQSEILKVKNQMAYVGFGVNNPEQGKNNEHIENLLRNSNAQNKELLKKIELLESNKISSSSTPMPQLEDSRKWMQAMLAQKQEENDKLRGEIRDHIRSFLCQTDQTMQLTKRLNESEKNLQRARSEVVRLKIKIEEMVANENRPSSTSSPLYTAKPNRVVEKLKFVVEKKEEPVKDERPLKERIVHQIPVDSQIRTPDTSSVFLEQSCIERSNESLKPEEPEPPVPRNRSPDEAGSKRSVRMNTKVHVVYDDGDTTVEILAEDKFTAGAKKMEKPVGHQVDVVDVADANAAMNCNQQ